MPRVYVDGIEDAEVRASGGYRPGEYTFEINGAGTDVSQRTGRECTKMDLTIIEGPDDDAGNPVADRPFTYRVWSPMASDDTDKQATMKGMLRGFLEKVGCPFDNQGFDTDDLIGLTFRAKLSPQRDKPEYMEIKRVLG